MPAPCFGEDNSYIYGTLLGMTQKEIDELEREGVIGTVPVSTELQFTQVTNSVKITKAKHLHTNLSPKLEKTDGY